MQRSCTAKQEYHVQFKSPMGWIKIIAVLEMEDETHFHGQAKLMGFSNAFSGGVRDKDHISFDICVKLPFGMLDVHIEADVAEDGSVSGVGIVPRRKPIEIKGERVR